MEKNKTYKKTALEVLTKFQNEDAEQNAITRFLRMSRRKHLKNKINTLPMKN